MKDKYVLVGTSKETGILFYLHYDEVRRLGSWTSGLGTLFDAPQNMDDEVKHIEYLLHSFRWIKYQAVDAIDYKLQD